MIYMYIYIYIYIYILIHIYKFIYINKYMFIYTHTGKTESTKDLASALAKCCYVFNCSPEMDYLGLGNIFKGLASSGSWGCFDEFNRLIPEVLSVCTVQFKSVCDGVKAESARIVIESDEISLDPTCGAFITMNPGIYTYMYIYIYIYIYAYIYTYSCIHIYMCRLSRSI
jgi:hypothetical protein